MFLTNLNNTRLKNESNSGKIESLGFLVLMEDKVTHQLTF